MDVLLQDLRYGVRQIIQQRGSSLVAVLTLALGIGASTAILSIIDATILRPLPYPEPDRLVEVRATIVQSDGRLFEPSPSMADMRLFEQADDIFSSVAGWGGGFRQRIVDLPEPERISVNQFTEDYLSLHGVTPLIGRDFTYADTEFGAPTVVLLGYSYWQRRYGGVRDVLGQTLRLDDGVATIVGVLPAGFEANVQLARPLQILPAEVSRRGTGRVSIYARLRPEVTAEQASDRLSARMGSEPLPDGSMGRIRVIVSSRIESTVRGHRTTVLVLAGAVAMILLIACVNVAGLLLARGTVRQVEFAVRASLGAGRLRILRQLLTENVVLALAGTVVGVLLARISLDAIVANIGVSPWVESPVRINVRVLGATLALLVPTVLLFGLAPASRLARLSLAGALARGGRQTGSPLSRRGGQWLMAAEISLAMVLVTGAGLMVRSFARLTTTDLGFNPEGVLTMEVLPLDREPAAHKAYYSALLERLRTIPGVQSAGLVDNFALGDGSRYTSLRGSADSVFTRIFGTLPGYFEAMAVRLQAGRLPTDADDASGFRGAVVTESAARALFPDGQAVGRQVSRANRNNPAAWTVIGVIADLRHGGPLDSRGANFPGVFLPFDPTVEDLRSARSTMVVVRRSRVAVTGEQLRQAAQSVGPRVLVERIRTADEWFGDRVVTPRRRTVMLGLLGGLGLALALVGVFGMTAYAVSRRTAEIGLRMAIGARPDQVVTTILRDAAMPIALGTIVGTGAAALTTRVIQSFLFETTPTDAVTFVAVALTLMAAGCLAALVPALRAARIDPIVMLRAE